ncbi:Uncharacterised protein (plasmid) [Tsukamurella tyrosinosolvens]|uniref:Uncharacterized protein n=1 Tax=Tsukamurella tyrosinosolvens TaxID=57704 RepID=A0A1H4UZT9_TSUTY|nr:hypothetical protein [Tsukamurella tyrosinosolvens]KXO91091.1 hypothetical protein AXK58_21925 [Tsukamurella tyrosinosolvens]SEC74225.1 hypothetical protein SAMN04489793_3093 [Tsukamurella tyrosinosolvens]VEH90775.1 Uncharacterised protein [Tsukamurella tyrosinosolvens]
MPGLNECRLPDVLDVLARRLDEDPTIGFAQRYRAGRFIAALRARREKCPKRQSYDHPVD